MSDYVEKEDATYRIKGCRVSLDSIIFAFQRGASPESIQRSFSTLSLEEVYGAVAFYLAHQQEVDEYLETSCTIFSEMEMHSRSKYSDWYNRLQVKRKESSFV
ncbi:MAG: DUF433 domain-containing protein [Pyrinomonadaceae bacterium]